MKVSVGGHLGTGVVLVVDDEHGIVRHVERRLRSVLRVRSASSVAAAMDVLRERNELCGAIVDVGLPDGSGLDIAGVIREQSSHVPVMILTGNHDPAVINRAHALGVSYVAKPDYVENLSRFIREVLVHPQVRQPLAQASEVFVKQYALSAREAQILGLATNGVPRGRLAGVLGVSENTVKSQVRSLLDKCGESTLADAVWQARFYRTEEQQT